MASGACILYSSPSAGANQFVALIVAVIVSLRSCFSFGKHAGESGVRCPPSHQHCTGNDLARLRATANIQ